MSHPNPNLPNSLALSAQRYQSELELLLDCWDGLKDKESKYLFQEAKEPSKAYSDRIKRTTFDNRFEPAIKDYAGLLSVFSLNDDVAQSFLDNQNNIDNQGNDLWTFFHEADQYCLRDGWCGVYVDFPPEDSSILSQADMLLRRDRHPYLVLIDRRNILNWRIDWSTGKARLLQVTIKEIRLEPEGTFGEKESIYYRVLRPGEWGVYQIVEKGNDAQLIEVEYGRTSLEEIPLVYYSVTESQIFQAKAPFLNLAKLNIEHYQKRSQLNEVLRKCNLPVPVRKGLIRSMDDLKKAPSLILGPNSFLDIPADGDFYFAEPSGIAISASQSDLEKIEQAMDRMTLDFLVGGDTQKTATEVLLNSTKTSANLKGVARRKESAIQQILKYWVAYTGETEEGTIAMDEDLLQMPLSPEQVDRLESLTVGGLLSQRTLLLLLQRGKVLPRQFDIEEELANHPSRR